MLKTFVMLVAYAAFYLIAVNVIGSVLSDRVVVYYLSAIALVLLVACTKRMLTEV